MYTDIHFSTGDLEHESDGFDRIQPNFKNRVHVFGSILIKLKNRIRNRVFFYLNPLNISAVLKVAYLRVQEVDAEEEGGAGAQQEAGRQAGRIHVY